MEQLTKTSSTFEAKTLEEAYEKATSHFKCSINALEIEVKQTQSSGFFGFFAKNAIIEATVIKNKKVSKNTSLNKKQNKQKVPQETKEVKPSNQNIKENKESTKIFDDFYNKDEAKTTHDNIKIKQDDNLITTEIQTKINELFETTCYKLDEIKVCYYDSTTIYIEFKGEDAALLIGKEGYRYKALSYILFNWIHEKYNLMLRLEVAEFLTTQEEAIHNYLVPVIQTIKDDGFFKTKPLDGVLVHIALKRLREEFPNKYVAVKTNIKGDKYILVNEYRK